MQSEIIQSVRALAEAQKNCWASKWPSERVSDTVLGADTRCMVDDGSEERGGWRSRPCCRGRQDHVGLLGSRAALAIPSAPRST